MLVKEPRFDSSDEGSNICKGRQGDEMFDHTSLICFLELINGTRAFGLN